MAITKEDNQELNKAKYVERLKEVYRQKNNTELSHENALEYFEQLVALVATITSHIPVDKIVSPKDIKQQDSQFGRGQA